MKREWNGRNLRALREGRKLPQQEVAVRMSVHQVTVGRWESSYKGPTLVDAISLALALEVTLDQLISSCVVEIPEITPPVCKDVPMPMTVSPKTRAAKRKKQAKA